MSEALSERENDVNARHRTDTTAPLPPPTGDGADGEAPDSWPLDDPDPTEPTTPDATAPDPADPDPADPDPAAPDPVDLEAVDLDEDPFDDDLAERLARRAPRIRATRLTVALAGGVLLVIGFVGGSLAQKQWGQHPTAPTNPFAVNGRGTGAFPNASGAPGGLAGRGAAPITGTVKLVDGSTVYIVTSDGRVVTVKTGGDTTVSQPGTLANLTTGATVSITGQTGADGTVTATAITKTK
jgi:hypothetical protein